MNSGMDLFGMCVEVARSQAAVARIMDPVREVRQAAIDRAEVGAGSAWMERALAAIRRVAAGGVPFTTNDVWRAMGDDTGPRERRAIGAAMQKAARLGMIRARVCDRCGHQETRDGPERNHGRPMALWEACRP